MIHLYNVLEQYHKILSLDDGGRGESNLTDSNIDAGKCVPIQGTISCIIRK